MQSLLRPFPTPLTGKQWFYLLFLQGVGAGIIDGGANFGIAYAKIKMWVLAKNTIAGDLGVTPIIQCLASMLITSTLVHTDLHHHAVAPLPYVWPHVEHLPDPRILLDKIFRRKDLAREKTEDEKDNNYPSPGSEIEGHKGWLYYPNMLVRFTFEGTEANILFSPFKAKLFIFKAFLTAAQGALLGIFCGLPLWCLFIVVLGPIYKNDNMAETGWKWAPMVIKCIYGAVLGWVTNPIIAGLALGSQAERHLLVIEHDEESVAENASRTVDVDGVPTIVEEDELTPPQFPPSPHASLSRSPRLSPYSSPMPASRVLPAQNVNRPRTRSRASTLSRPPLTANCSDLPIIPSRSLNAPQYSGGEALAVPKTAPLVQTGRMRSLSQATALGAGAEAGAGTGSTSLGTPARTAVPAPGTPLTGPRETLAPPSPLPYHTIMTPSGPRRRGLTVSTAYTASSSTNGNNIAGGIAATNTGGAPGTGGSGWSYALGGTGGRNQRRPRASSSLSGKGGGKEKIPGELWSKSAIQMGASGTPAVTAAGEEEEVLAEDADRSGEVREGKEKRAPAWDVFGIVQGAERGSQAGNKSGEKKEGEEQS
ncbi:hypothetical protein I352_04738 [Cryptococcus deuterogattii MMRL2647]|nr:hypothetical protein I352_04738 [Cryptococcus deuterogattii MMRL2647]